MRPIINGNFSELDVAKLAVIALAEGGFADEKISCFKVQIPAHHLQGLTRHESFSTTGSDSAELSGGGMGALSGAAVGSAIGAAIGIAALPVLGPMVAAAAVGVGAYGGSLYGVLDAESAAADHSNGAKPHGDIETFGSSEIRQRQSGTLVAVVAESEALQAMATQILMSQGATDIELTQGDLDRSEWSDFNPRRPLVR